MNETQEDQNEDAPVESEDNVDNSEKESQAIKRGWIPADEWKGDASKHIPADEFLKKRDAFGETMKERMHALEQAVKDTSDAAKEFRAMSEKAREREKKQYLVEIERLKQARSDAVEHGDSEAFNDVDTKLREAEKEVADIPQTPPPEIKEFMGRNDWYGQDDGMSTATDMFFKTLNEKSGSPLGEKLKATEDYIKRLYPEKFSNQKRETAHVPDRGRRETMPKPKGRSYGNLPKSARDACDDFVAKGWLTQEKYVEDYGWEE